MSHFEEYLEATKEKKPDFPLYTMRDGIKLVNAYDFDKFVDTTKYVKDIDIAVKSTMIRKQEEKDAIEKHGGVGSIPSEQYLRKSLLLMRWLHDNKDAMYYGKPHESFSVNEAITKAKQSGKSIIILDDMS